MVELTPSAANKLQTILTEKGLTGYGLRVFISGGGCGGMQYGMGFDNTTHAGDATETVQGIQLYVDPISAGFPA